jgi:hypothetical protein
MRGRGFSSVEVLLCGTFLCAFAAWGFAEAVRARRVLEEAETEQAVAGLVGGVAAEEVGRILRGEGADEPGATPAVERREIVNGRPLTIFLYREEVESCPGLVRVTVEAAEAETAGRTRVARLVTGARGASPSDSR